ncbi:MAG: Rpn family recombination-promoting nuclease/putative transposase [Parabacteroides sp.]|nr:Rpn family recombination-promoting nuclease/putative transposase [Parabacteroides sp.]
MGKFMNPFTDVGFKHLFGREVSKDLLLELLRVILGDERRVKRISLLNKEKVPKSMDQKVVIYDILCEDEDGTKFIVEIQNQYQDYFLDRALYYLCRMIDEQGLKGSAWNYEIYPVYGIFFLNFKIAPLTKFRTDVILADRETGKMVNSKMRHIYLSLPYFTKQENECETDFDRWIYLLKNMDSFKEIPEYAPKSVFGKILEVANVASLSPEERLEYDQALKHYRDYNNTMHTQYRQGKEKGLAEGEAIGLAKGLAEGKAKGIRQMLQNMQEMGIDITTMAKIAKLSEAEVTNILQE